MLPSYKYYLPKWPSVMEKNYDIKTFFNSRNEIEVPVCGQVTTPSFLAAMSSSAYVEIFVKNLQINGDKSI